ncbi:hypothetical protein RJ639_036592 [Escallonia herrerae]|uniref:Chalcone/stilbene synthase N-terminal domain-containing protein n=1 Tax=Escallonia herrerae TaxID=1293975 RepID=A0AA88WS79_9ASTE|nr:hypothetical protein RJ639_036592 [Escallonia herrerae]
MPGADYHLTKLFGLHPFVKRLMIYQQGCFANGTVLRLAKDLTENNAGHFAPAKLVVDEVWPRKLTGCVQYAAKPCMKTRSPLRHIRKDLRLAWGQIERQLGGIKLESGGICALARQFTDHVSCSEES